MKKFKLYRKMSIEEYTEVHRNGLNIHKSDSIIMCPKKCLSESLITTRRLNSKVNSLFEVTAEITFPEDFRGELISQGIFLSHDIYSDERYSLYKKYEGMNLHYHCHGKAIDLNSYEIDESYLEMVNKYISGINQISSESYVEQLVESYFGDGLDIYQLVTNKLLRKNEYYLQMPLDLALLAMRFNAIPKGGLNKLIKSRNISKSFDNLEISNSETFPVTLAVKLSIDTLPSRISRNEASAGVFSIESNSIAFFNRCIESIRMVDLNIERSRYKYASDILNKKIKIDDILNARIETKSFQFSDAQINLEQALELLETNPSKSFFVDNISNINEKLINADNYHDLYHAQRVCLYAMIISSYLGISERYSEALIQACLLHDIGKTENCEENNHGTVGAQIIEKMAISINDVEIKKLIQFLIEAHALQRNHPKIEQLLNDYQIINKERAELLLNILMDADALDRTRFTVFGKASAGLKIDLLEIPFSKSLVELSEFISKIFYDNANISLKKDHLLLKSNIAKGGIY